MDAGATRSMGQISAAVTSASMACAFATSRAGTITRAPACARARTVSRPRPECPPVTTATLPCRSTPAMTSAEVLWALKPDAMGCWEGMGVLMGVCS